tara:strand:- start:540 stop:806 length:267 start_codon:yes stop_codon:yes gene_type:complete
MPTIEDHNYLKICAQLASSLSISLASAKRQVEFAANRTGKKDLQSRKVIAEKLLKKALSEESSKDNSANQLDKLLEALASEENFMVED